MWKFLPESWRLDQNEGSCCYARQPRRGLVTPCCGLSALQPWSQCWQPGTRKRHPILWYTSARLLEPAVISKERCGQNSLECVWTKSRGWALFQGWALFHKTRVKCFRYILPTLIFIDAIPKKKGALKLLLGSCLSQKFLEVKPLETTETTEMTISQEHFFQLTMRKCDVSG